MAVHVAQTYGYGTRGSRVGLLAPNPYGTRRHQRDDAKPTGRFRPAFADDPRAACNPLTHPTVKPDWWFAPEEEPRDEPGGRTHVTTDADAKRAIAICHGCPLRWPCLTHALGDATRPPESAGIWGGEKFPVVGSTRRAELAAKVARHLRKESA